MAGNGKRKKVGDSAPSDNDAWMDEIITELRDGDYDDTGVVKTMTTQATITRKGEGTSKGSMGEVAGKGGKNTGKGKSALDACVPVEGYEHTVKGGVAGKGGMAAGTGEVTGGVAGKGGKNTIIRYVPFEIWQEARETRKQAQAQAREVAGKGGMAAGTGTGEVTGKGDMAAGKGGIHENAGNGDMAAGNGGKGEVTGKGDMAAGKGGKGEVTLPLKGDGKGNFKGLPQSMPIVGMTRPRRVAVPGMAGAHLDGIPQAHIWHAEAEPDRNDTDHITIQPTHIMQIPLDMAQGNTLTHVEVAETMRDSTRFNGPTHKNPYGNWVGGGVKIPKCTDKESSGTLWIPSRGILSFGNGHSWIFKIFRIFVIFWICHEKYNVS